MFVIPAYTCHSDICLLFRHMFVIPAYACHSDRSGGILSLPDTTEVPWVEISRQLLHAAPPSLESSTAVEMTMDQSFINYL